MAFSSLCFLISPDEMRQALEPFTLFVSNVHVPVGYTCTPTDEFLAGYTEFYDKLSAGERIDHKADHKILGHYSFTTDISSVKYGRKHIYNGSEYMLYEGSDRGFAPYLAPFALSVYTENGRLCVSTRGSYMINGANIMGYEMVFPQKSEAVHYGVESEKDWPSYNDHTLFKDTIMKMTSALTISVGGVTKRTSVRVSDKAMEIIPNIRFIGDMDIRI